MQITGARVLSSRLTVISRLRAMRESSDFNNLDFGFGRCDEEKATCSTHLRA
jgi:hypothetical protein